MAPPSDDILRRMCVGLRVPELQAELRRRGKSGEGKRVELVDRMVGCLRSDFVAVDTAAAASSASAAGVYHEDTAQPMWGWSDYLKGPKVFLTTTIGRFGVRNAITGCGEQRGGFSGAVSNKVFSNGKHWFEFKAREPATFLHLCFLSVVDANKSDEDMIAACTSGDRQLFTQEGRGASFVCLNCGNHVPYERWSNRNFMETVVCLDIEERRLSFLIDGRYHCAVQGSRLVEIRRSRGHPHLEDGNYSSDLEKSTLCASHSGYVCKCVVAVPLELGIENAVWRNVD